MILTVGVWPDTFNSMKFLFLVVLIVSFIGMAVFGFAGMTGNMGHGHSDCIASVVQGVCPETLGTLDFINFHAGAMKFFSTAVFGVSVLASLVLFCVFYSGCLAASFLRQLSLRFKYRLPQFLLTPAALPGEALNFWLILHEKRDPSFSCGFR